MNKDRHSPAPPKLSTYDSETEWKPYILQFNHIAKKYNWTEAKKLDKLIECLRDRALKFLALFPRQHKAISISSAIR
jgi:hypothetical protein